MVWPLDPEIVQEFAKGLDQIIVVEEKRSLLETQLREQLCNDPKAPMIIGKKDEKDATLFPAWGTLEPNQIAVAIAERLLKKRKSKPVEEKLAAIKAAMGNVSNSPSLAERIPYFCAGCPHNSSTVVPEGGRGYAGIGCHWMVQYIPARNTEGATHMGGEGANWIGEAPFSKPQARVPEPGRWHLQPFRPDGDPRSGRIGREHDLQDPVQRRGGHDRRADPRRWPDGTCHCTAGAR
jgi:indolepyruvate ferredoxin oxidoreductase